MYLVLFFRTFSISDQSCPEIQVEEEPELSGRRTLQIYLSIWQQGAFWLIQNVCFPLDAPMKKIQQPTLLWTSNFRQIRQLRRLEIHRQIYRKSRRLCQRRILPIRPSNFPSKSKPNAEEQSMKVLQQKVSMIKDIGDLRFTKVSDFQPRFAKLYSRWCTKRVSILKIISQWHSVIQLSAGKQSWNK